MRKFYLLFVLGIVALLSGCGEKSNQVTMSPTDQLATGKEITISLNGQTSTTTEVTPTAPTATTPATTSSVSQEMPMEAALVTVEAPTNQQIQQALKNAGLYEGPVDGVLGKKSKGAIKTFQEQNGLTADGKVGKKTWAKLGTYLNVAAPSVTSTVPSN